MTVNPTSFTLLDKNQKLIHIHKLIQLHELCIQHLIQIVSHKLSSTEYKLLQTQYKLSQSSKQQQTMPNQPQTITAIYNLNIIQKDYETLQQAVQKAQQQVRKHIGIEHQMKICLQQLQQQLNQVVMKNQSIKKQLVFLKKELSTTKKNQLLLQNKLNSLQEQLISYQHQLKLNQLHCSKHNTSLFNNQLNTYQVLNKSKLNTQQTQSPDIFNNTSNKSLHKSFQSNTQKLFLNNNKRPIIGKMLTKSKLGSRKQSKLLIDNDIDIGLESFITLSMHKKKDTLSGSKNSNENSKEMFWNKRLKKKQSSTVHGLYSDITQHHSINRSLNISPRQLKKKLKQKQLKNIYSINPTKKTNTIYSNSNEQTVLKRKDKSIKHSTYYNPPNNCTYQLNRQLTKNHKIDTMGGKTPSRSKSIPY